jgi:hypothetical protein
MWASTIVERRLAALALCASAAFAELRLGRGTVDITPPDGMPMGGGFTIRVGKAAHDPLHCKALVFDRDGVRAGLVSCDVESFHRPWIVKARARIDANRSIPGDRVMITATHTHSGPEMTPFVLDGATGETRRIADSYHAALPDRIAQAVADAERNLVPARIWFARASEDSVSFNRRYFMRDGTLRTNPGQMNPDIARVAGPIDPELLVVYFDTPDGKPLATIVNFALHTTAWGGAEFSADFPGVIAQRLAEAKDTGMLTLFLQGCSGNINQVDVSTRERQSGPAATSRIATVLAAQVIKAYRRMEPVPDSALQVRSVPVDLPVPIYTPGQVAEARKVIEASRGPGPGGPKFLDLVHAFRVVNVMEVHQGRPIPTEAQAIAFGRELAILGLPAEVFVELGMALKRASPFPRTVVSELANDMLDYIPNLRAFPEQGYESTTARCSPGCGELLVHKATELLVDLAR